MLAVATISSRAGAEETFTYRVQAGDTCAGIALRVYGDEKRIDLIHDSNADLGPPPHALAPGRVLVLPKLKTPERGGPDARVSRIRNRVEVQVPEPRPAKLEDPLVRGNRVGTEVASGADVTFRDETQVRLGERTLVVILGDRRSNAAVVSSAETMLVSGELRARLGALSGRGAPTRVETKGAAVAMTNGEAKVSVDPAEATRLARRHVTVALGAAEDRRARPRLRLEGGARQAPDPAAAAPTRTAVGRTPSGDPGDAARDGQPRGHGRAR